MIIPSTAKDLPKVPLMPISAEEALIYKGDVYELTKTCRSGTYKEFFIVKELT